MNQQQTQAARDIAVVLMAIAAAWLFTRFLLYPALSVPDNAPMLLRPIAGFLAAWWLLHRAGQHCPQLGLARPRSLLWLLIACVLLYAVMSATARWLVPPLARALGAQGSPQFLAYIAGNTIAFAGWIAIGWLVGGLIEELLFRGFLLDRVSQLAGGGAIGAAAGIVAQALLFGALHLYQGSTGFVFTGLFALVYGVAFIVLGRNLWPLILVHGAWNSVAITGFYRAG
jgi:uncharacterized protein